VSSEEPPVDGHEHGDTANLRTRAAKGVFWVATGAWGRQLMVFIVFAILARVLEPEDFGLVALAAVFVGFTHVIAEEGLVDALVQRKDLDTAHLDTAFWVSIAFALLLTALLLGLATPIAAVLGEESLAPVLMVLALSIPIGSSSLVQRALLTRDMKFKSLTLRSLAAIAVGSVFGVGAALLGYGVWSLVAQNLAGQLTGAIVLWRVTDWRPGFNLSYTHFRDIFSFGRHVVGFRLIIYFNRRADEFLIGAFLGTTQLGFYTIGVRMLRMLIQVTSSLIDRVSFPLYSRLQDNPERLRRAYYKSATFAGLIAYPTFFSILVLAPQIVSVFFGPKWGDSVAVMQVLTIFGVNQVLTYLNGTTVKALGKPSWLVGIVATTAFLKVAAFFVAVSFGLVAVAVATTLVGYLVAPLYFGAVKRLLPVTVREYASNLRTPLLTAAAVAGGMLGASYLLRDLPDPVILVVVGTAGAVAYVLAIRVFAPGLAREVQDLVRRALPRRRFARPPRRTAETLRGGPS
jgi:O-antigen/teichoic acid export membrane protein